MGYKLYYILKDEYSKRQGESHPLLRLDVPELKTEQEVVDKIVELCMTSKLTLKEIRIMEELEVESWGNMRNDFQK